MVRAIPHEAANSNPDVNVYSDCAQGSVGADHSRAQSSLPTRGGNGFRATYATVGAVIRGS